MKVLPRSMSYGATLAVAAFAVACSDSGTDPAPVTPQVIEETTFAPELGIVLSEMTRSSSGMYVQVREEGTGDQAAVGSSVEIAYVGFLTNGVVFDAGAFTFTLGSGQVIPGFDEGVTGMRTGEQRVIVIPPALAYGNQGAGSIPPGSILIFELEARSVS